MLVIVYKTDNTDKARYVWHVCDRSLPKNIEVGNVRHLMATSFELKFIQDNFPDVLWNDRSDWRGKDAKTIFAGIKKYMDKKR
jgi:hypothetical protein